MCFRISFGTAAEHKEEQTESDSEGQPSWNGPNSSNDANQVLLGSEVHCFLLIGSLVIAGMQDLLSILLSQKNLSEGGGTKEKSPEKMSHGKSFHIRNLSSGAINSTFCLSFFPNYDNDVVCAISESRLEPQSVRFEEGSDAYEDGRLVFAIEFCNAQVNLEAPGKDGRMLVTLDKAIVDSR